MSIENASHLKRWDEFVESHPHGTPYHLSGWLRAIRDTYGFQPLLYSCRDASGRISAVFPCFFVRSQVTGDRIVSLPFSDCGGPLVTTEDEESILLHNLVSEYGDRAKYLEIRTCTAPPPAFQCHDHYQRHVLSLRQYQAQSEDTLRKRTIQYSLRKARREGIVIREDNDEPGLAAFCTLNSLTRKHKGVPSQPDRFFQNLYDHVIRKGRGSIHLAYSGSIPVAATLLLYLNGTVYYKYNASHPRYLREKTPNHLLTLHIIEQACTAGYRYLDFGRTAPENLGLVRYKEQWGAQADSLPYYYYPTVQGITTKEQSSLFYRTLTNVWHSLPARVTNSLGPLLYRHIA
jgi:hypothetical protein